MSSNGWIKLHRQIMDHPFYQEKRVFSRHEAWEYILLKANYENTKTMISGKLVEVPRGSFITSEAKLMDRFQWGKQKLRNFLKMAEEDGMICRRATNLHTQLSVTRYDDYQGISDQDSDQQKPNNGAGSRVSSDQSADFGQTADRPHADQRPATDKEIKNIKKNKEVIYTIFDHWNSKKIIVHKELTEVTKSAINARLKVHKQNVLLEAIDNYYLGLSDIF